MGCCKFVVVTFTAIVFLSGLGLLGYGIYHIANLKRFEITGTQIVDYAIIGVASLLSLLGFIGTVGLCCVKKCLLKLYFSLILILLLAEIACVIYLFADESGFQKLVTKGWNDMPDAGRVQLQEKFLCCGMERLNTIHPSSNHTSCFEQGKLTGRRLNNCYASIRYMVEQNIEMVAGIFGALAFLQFGLLVTLPIHMATLGADEEEKRIQMRQTKVRPMPSDADGRYDRMRAGGHRHAPPVQHRSSQGMAMHAPHSYGRTQTHRMNLNRISNDMYGYRD